MPMGSAPYGLGTPVTSEAPPDGPAGCRYLNPATRDYELDPDTGQFAQMPHLRHRVLHTLLMIQGSSTARPIDGVKQPRRMGPTFEAEMRASVRAAMRQMTDIEKVMLIEDIAVERGRGGRARVTVSYRDLTTGLRDQATA